MGKIIVKKAIVRKPGLLYYLDKQGNLCSAVMKHGGKKKKAKSKSKK